MRKLPVLGGALATAALIAACGGTGPAASTGVTIPPVNVPSIPIPSNAIPSLPIGSFSIPSFAIPSFNEHSDAALEARYPQTIDGQPVTDVKSYQLSQFVQLMAVDDQAKASGFLSALVNAGLDPTTIAFGTGEATVSGDDVSLESIHTPGADASKFVALWPQLAQLGESDEALPTVTTSTVGGKNVTVMTDSSGDVTYIYPQSDIVWSFDSNDASEAATILQALP